MGISGQRQRVLRWPRRAVTSLLWLIVAACGGQANPGADSDPGTGGQSTPSSGGTLNPASGGVPSVDVTSGGITASGGLIVVPPGGSANDFGGGSVSVASGGMPQPARACNLLSSSEFGGGFLLCGDGSHRRPEASDCVTEVPRPEPAAVCHAADECCFDSDCPSGPHAFCTYGTCTDGCVSDAECPADSLCRCADPVGRCVPATCRSDADCPADYPCSSGNSLWDVFACQAPADQCLVDSDCGSAHCFFTLEGRQCVILPG